MTATDVVAGLVSVVIPVYNGERFLREALDSVAAQEHEPVEVIVVDDGSVDASASIAKAAGVRYVHQENQGIAGARNRGLELARGEFVAWLDADDVMRPGKLSAQVGHLRAHPEIGLVLTRQELLVEDGASIPEWMVPDATFGDPGGVEHSSALFRRSVVDDVGRFDPSYRVCEGMDWLARIRAAGIGIAVLDRKLLGRRIHGSNISSDRAAMKRELLQSLKAKIDRERAGS